MSEDHLLIIKHVFERVQASAIYISNPGYAWDYVTYDLVVQAGHLSIGKAEIQDSRLEDLELWRAYSSIDRHLSGRDSWDVYKFEPEPEPARAPTATINLTQAWRDALNGRTLTYESTSTGTWSLRNSWGSTWGT